jgi:sec-independent protein translocase protein TatB
MEFLGIGPLELFFILIIALIVLGPKDMVKAGRTLGRFLRRLVTSPTWQTVQRTSHDLRYLPNKLMREAGVEEDMEELNRIGKDMGGLSKEVRSSLHQSIDQAEQDLQEAQAAFSAWTTPPDADAAANPGPGDLAPAAPPSQPENPASQE